VYRVHISNQTGPWARAVLSGVASSPQPICLPTLVTSRGDEKLVTRQTFHSARYEGAQKTKIG